MSAWCKRCQSWFCEEANKLSDKHAFSKKEGGLRYKEIMELRKQGLTRYGQGNYL